MIGQVESRELPRPRESDIEEVHCALSVARSLWHRGDETDALKWLRRAVEAAADQDADRRALELAKAAADVATSMTNSEPPPSERDEPNSANIELAPPPSALDPGRAKFEKNPYDRVGEETEGETIVRPKTALRRALTRIDPQYPARIDLKIDDIPPSSAPPPSSTHGDGKRDGRDTVQDRPNVSEFHRAQDAILQQEAVSSPPTSEGSAPHHGADHTTDGNEVAHAVETRKMRATPAVPRPTKANQPAPSGPADNALEQFRVALLPIPEEGEVRLLFLADDESPPPGIATATLVAPSLSDAEKIAEIYQQTAAKL